MASDCLLIGCREFGSPAFQNGVQLLDKRFTQRIICAVDNHINALEMVGGLDHIIHLNCPIRYADGI